MMADNLEIKLENLSVMIGIPAGRDLPALTVKSLFATQAKMNARNIDCHLGIVAGSAVVQWARDEVVDTFLKSPASHLFWVDSDMVWEPEQFLRMLAISTLPGHEVVCAAYPAKMDAPTFYINYDVARAPLRMNPYGLVEIDGLGLGFTVMRREVVEKLAERAPQVIDDAGNRTMAAVFRVDEKDGRRRGEDIAFFHDVRAMGYKVWLDGTVDLGHVGSKVYRGTIRDVVKQ